MGAWISQLLGGFGVPAPAPAPGGGETKAEEMTLRWASGSPSCWRVLIVMEEKGVKFNSKLLFFEKLEEKEPDVLTLNPRGQLPVFTHGDVGINESLGTCMYLESLYEHQGTKLIPDSRADLGMMFQRMVESLTFKDRMADVVFYEFKNPPGTRFEAVLNRNKELLTKEVNFWEKYLEEVPEGGYLAGSEFSMADAAAFPCMAAAFHYGLNRERYPNITAYYNFLKSRPSIQATWPPTYPGKTPALLKDI